MREDKYVDSSTGSGVKIKTREGVVYDAGSRAGHARALAARLRAKIKPKPKKS